jgi:hypothetical protein
MDVYVGTPPIVAAIGAEVVAVGTATGVVKSMAYVFGKRCLATWLWTEEVPPLLTES